jgi:hypothetical protein
MRHFTRLTSGIAAIALLAGVAAPAAARDRGPPPRHHHHHRNNGSDVVGTIAAVGLVAVIAAAIASSSARKAGQPPAPRSNDDDDRGYDEADARYDDRADGPRFDDGYGVMSQDGAVDACVLAARDRATVESGFAEVREVGVVRPLDNGWDVTGTLVVRSNYRGIGQLRDFRCAFRSGRVDAVSLR